MSLPYQSATSGQRALNEIQKIVRTFGCDKFATGEDFANGEVFIQFEYRGRMVHLKASARGYAAAWLKEHPWTSRRRSSKAEYERKALELGSVAVYSVLRDWIKGQLTAIEAGIMTFDAALLGHIALPDGRRVIDAVEEAKMLPAEASS